MADPVPLAPLGGVAAAAGLAVAIAEEGPVAMIALRGTLSDPGFGAAVTAAAGLSLPPVRRIASERGRTLLWFSPDELLLLAPFAEGPALTEALAGALSGQHAMALDVSGARALFRLEGDAAREVLAKGVPADLSRAAFGVGDVRRSHMGQIAVAFWQEAERPDLFRLLCARSVAGYAFDWLAAAANPRGLPGVL
jgi:sarcosine oxidase subunit gamma